MMASKRIIVLRSNPIDPDPRVEKLAKTLACSDYSVKVIGWDRNCELPPITGNGNVRVIRLPIKSVFGKGLGNLPALLRWQYGLFQHLTKYRDTFDIIHACDFDTVLPALFCKYFFGKRVVYDIFDFYADHLRATPEIIKRIIRFIDLWTIGRVDGLILVDETRWQQIDDVRVKNNTVIYNTPEDVLQQLESSSLTSRDCELNVCYVGLMQVERGLVELMTVMGRHSEWRLDLAGFGGDEDRIVRMAQSFSNITWHGRVPYKKALELSYKSDLLIATYDPTIPNHRFASPNKVFEAMMLCKPIIVSKHTNIDRIVKEADCGLAVPYGDVAALETALSALQSDASLRSRLGKNARLAYENKYNWQRMETRLLRLYTAIKQ